MDLTATPSYLGPSRSHRGRPPFYTAGTDTYLGIGMAAEHLGISRWTLRLWDMDPKKRLPAYTIGKFRYWKRSDLDAWLARNRTPVALERTATG
jgi:hypothetical protein